MPSGGGPTQRGIGRSRELAAAAFARDAARSGVGGVLAVVGPAGSGKTWLCEAIAEAAGTEGFRVGWGTGWPGEGVPPLWPWQQALGPFGDRDATVELLGDPPAADDPAWFGRAVAVVDVLRRLATEQPLLLVLDDLHHADEPTRRLAQFVARHVRGLPLVLLVAHQPDDALAALDAEASPLALRGLDPGETAALLAARGVEGLAGTDLAFVVRASGGLPGTLHHLANAAEPGAPGGAGGPGAPRGPGGAAAGVVAALVDLRVAELPEPVRRAAAHAAVADRAPRLAEVAAIAPDVRVSPGVVADELERRGLARDRAAEGFAFAHEQVRVALAATLDPAEVLDIHARVAGLLAGPPPTLDRRRRRAEHALAAAARSAADAGLAVQAVHDVAADLLAANQADLAAELLAAAESAHEAAGGAGPVAALLATRGRALQRGGRLAAAREQFHRAAGAAEAEDDAESLAVAVLGLGGVWLAEERSPLDRERFLHLHRRATRALPDASSALRLRLDVRRAAEDAYATGSLDGIEAQVAAARGFGDPALLAEALSLYHHTILGPAHRQRRAAVADEMLAAAARAGDDWLGLMALLWLTADQFLAGSPRAEQSVRELHDRAAAINGRHAGYIAKVMDATLLQRAGRLAEAEAAAGLAYAAGTEVGDADAVAYFGGQLVTLRWIQGRADEVLDLAAETATSPTITPLNRAFTATQASLAAAAGDLDRARVALRRLRGELRGIHQSSAWLVTLYSVVEAAHVLGDAEMAAEAAELLAPYADLPVVGSLGVSCLGSVRRSLGLAAVAVGDLDRGIIVLEQAVADNERLGNRPLAAMTGADLAAAHVARGAAGDDAAAATHLTRSIREAESMSLTRRAEEWRTLLRDLRDRRDPRTPDAGGRRATTTGAEVSPGPGGPEGTIELQGRSWRLCAGGHEVVVPDLLGMQYLVQLLVNPGVEIAATELVGDGSDPAAAAVHDTTDQPLLDPAALAAYRSRVAELEDDLAEAERNADPERATRARLELDAVVDELTRSTGRLGRSRRFSSPAERARTAVQKAVRRALDQVEKADAHLGAALRASVRTGRTCCYDPSPGAPTHWHRL